MSFRSMMGADVSLIKKLREIESRVFGRDSAIEGTVD